MAGPSQLARAHVALKGEADRLQKDLVAIERKQQEIAATVQHLRAQLDRPSVTQPDLRTEGLFRSLHFARRDQLEANVRMVEAYRQQHEREAVSPAKAKVEAARQQERAVAKLVEQRHLAAAAELQKTENLATDESARTRWLAQRAVAPRAQV